MDRISICKVLTKRNENDPFLKRMMTGDEKWVTYDNIVRKRSWSKCGGAAQTVAKPGLTARKNTVFGYIASGSIPVSSENKPHCGLIKDNVDLEKTMRRFWEIENVEPETIKNKETIISHSVEREHGRTNKKTFELSTVTYGTTSAPFLATRTLKQLALDEAGNFPLGSSVVMSDMYIDDILTGAETLLEAKELKIN
ncbi:integrase catalytic domain-containing protein [Trichonephila clavipes]|nr:integrase catalytic domain-containing protein [Trichonephila clavipes]